MVRSPATGAVRAWRGGARARAEQHRVVDFGDVPASDVVASLQAARATASAAAAAAGARRCRARLLVGVAIVGASLLGVAMLAMIVPVRQGNDPGMGFARALTRARALGAIADAGTSEGQGRASGGRGGDGNDSAGAGGAGGATSGPGRHPGPQAACALANVLRKDLTTEADEGAADVELVVGVGFFKAGTTELDTIMRQLAPRACGPTTKEVNFDWEGTSLAHAMEYAGHEEDRRELQKRMANFAPVMSAGGGRGMWGISESELNSTVEEAAGTAERALALRDELRRDYLQSVRGERGADDALRGGGECGRRVFEFSPLYGSGRKAPCTAELMRALFPRAHVLISVRDPVARAHSHHTMWYTHRCYDVLCSDIDQAALAARPRDVSVPLVQGASPACAELTSEVMLRRLLEVARDECKLTPASTWDQLRKCVKRSERVAEDMLSERVALRAGDSSAGGRANVTRAPTCATSQRGPSAPYYSPVLHSLYYLYAREWTSRFPCESVSLYSLESTHANYGRTVRMLAANVGIKDKGQIKRAEATGLSTINGGIYATASYDNKELSDDLRNELGEFFLPFQAEMMREVRTHGKCARAKEEERRRRLAKKRMTAKKRRARR